MLFMFFVLFVFTIVSDNFTTLLLIGIILTLIIFFNVLFRYFGWGIHKHPMPQIPFVADSRTDEFVVNTRKAIKEANEKTRLEKERRRKQEEIQSQEEKEEYENIMESEPDHYYVDIVDDVVNGAKSPATYLTQWMNNVAEIDEEDLRDYTNGVVDKYTFRKLLRNSESAWKNEEIVKALSVATGGEPEEWYNAYDTWKYEKDNQEVGNNE